MPSSTNEPRAPLDLITWVTGTAGDPTNDPFLNPAPTITSHVNGSPSSGEVAITASASALFCTPSDPDLHDVYWEEVNDARKRHRPDYDGAVNVVPGSIQLDEALRIQDGFASDGEAIEYHAVGLSDFLAIPKPAVSGTPSASLEIWTPYAWLNLDLAQLLWAWTKFHQSNKTTTDDLLDRDSFIAYSEQMSDHRFRQLWNVYRVVDKTIGEQAEEIAKQSFALFAFMSQSAGTHQSKLRLLSVDQVDENTRIFDTDRPEEGGDGGAGIFLTRRPQVRAADEYLVNQLKSTWGGGATLTGIAPPYGLQLTEPFNPPAEENLVRQRDEASVAKYGLVTSAETRPNAVEKGSAEGGFRLEASAARDRTAQLGMGPLHFDFLPGDVIHVRDTLHGLDGTEDLLVRVKTYDLDRPTATMELLELAGADYTVEPDDLEDLFLWLKGDAGVTSSGGPPPRVSQWNDQSGNGYNATALPGYLGPAYVANYQAGKGVIDFATYATGWLEFLAWPTGQEFPRGSNWTLIALWETRGATSYQSYLLSTQGLNWASSALNGELTFHLGDGVGGGTGPGWRDKHGDNASRFNYAPTDNRWVVGVWRPWASQSNWAISGASRGWCQFLDLATGTWDGTDDADPTEAHPGPMAYHASMAGFGQDTMLGRPWNSALAPPNIYLAELILYQHDRGKQELEAYDLDGLIRYLRSRWGV